MDLSEKRILLTGGTGFLGQHVLEALRGRGCCHVYWPSHELYDLCNREDVKRVYEWSQPDVVIHMAAVLGGIGAHMHTQGQFLYQNLSMGLDMLEQARIFGVKKYVNIGTSCQYPDVLHNPVAEDQLWRGFPNKTTAPYGIAKLALMYQGQTYREQYGMSTICVIPANVYGPKDHFDPKISHVIPALITNCLEAKDQNKPFVVWGTGKATREFIYATDCAEGIVKATEDYDSIEPVNLGTGVETPIAEVVRMVAYNLDYQGKDVWDSSKPDGHPGRVFDTTRAEKEFGFKAKTDLRTGLWNTINWYLRTVGRNG